MSKNTEFSDLSEIRLTALLRHRGRKVAMMPYNSPYDLMVDGKRIEVKAAKFVDSRYPQNGFWLFNIHRHNHVRESEVDYYVLVFANIPGIKKDCCYALFDAPMHRASVRISILQLIRGELANQFDRFDKFSKGKVMRRETTREGATRGAAD